MAFQSYEDDYAEVASELRQHIKRVHNDPLTSEDAGDALDSATELLSELRGIVGQSMKMGLRELGSGAEREAAERRMAEYQTDIEALTKDLERVRKKSMGSWQRQREELLGPLGQGVGSGEGGVGLGSSSSSSSLLGVAHRSEATLQRSMKDLHSTLGTGAATLQELRQQRERLERSKDKLHEAHGNLSMSAKVVRSMERRIMTNQLIRYVTIGILLVGIAAILYGMVAGKK